MKYIIEIKPEYEDSFKGLMILGAKDSNLFVDTLAVEDLEEFNSDYINEHFGSLQDDAYQRGFDDAHRISEEEYHRGLEEGKKAFDLLDAERDAEYQRGFEDGKAVSDKGCAGCEYAGKIVTGPPCITCSNSYKNQWTAKQTDDEIKVGDVVTIKHIKNSDKHSFVVTKVSDESVWGLMKMVVGTIGQLTR